jgi:hypothetical protein
MRWLLPVGLAVVLVGFILVGCGGSAPETETDQAPAAESSPASEGESAIHEDGFETGDESEWSEAEAQAADEDDDPEIP